MNRRRLLVLAALFAGIALLCVPIALAGKPKPGGGGGSYTITVTPGGPYFFGESISVTTNVPVSLSPYIWLKCYQNGVVVGTMDEAAFPGGWYYGEPMNLGPSASWSGGAADCTITVVHLSGGKTVTDASKSFHVNA